MRDGAQCSGDTSCARHCALWRKECDSCGERGAGVERAVLNDVCDILFHGSNVGWCSDRIREMLDRRHDVLH